MATIDELKEMFSTGEIPVGENFSALIDKIANTQGDPGKSAYQTAIDNGFVGSEIEWLESMKGERGETGLQGIQGIQGLPGIQGIPGERGQPGIQGERGERGETGERGEQGERGPTGIQGERGEKGETGQGLAIASSYSTYATALADLSNIADNAFVSVISDENYDGSGTVYIKHDGALAFQFITTGIRGEKGETGERGEQGPPGIQGLTGERGETGPQGERGEQGVPGPPADLTNVETAIQNVQQNLNAHSEENNTNAHNVGNISGLQQELSLRARRTKLEATSPSAQTITEFDFAIPNIFGAFMFTVTAVAKDDAYQVRKETYVAHNIEDDKVHLQLLKTSQRGANIISFTCSIGTYGATKIIIDSNVPRTYACTISLTEL